MTAVFVIALAAPSIVVNCESCERSGCCTGAGAAEVLKPGASVRTSVRSAVSVVAGTMNRVTLDIDSFRRAAEQREEQRIDDDEQHPDDHDRRLPHHDDERLQT